MTQPVLCAHQAAPWIEAPIGWQLLAEILAAGELEPIPCDPCVQTPKETP